MIGRQLGDYKILSSMGGGSFGTVYRAEHARSGHLVAIKLLHLTIAAAESQRMINEALAASRIRHPNVVQVYDMGLTSDRRPYIVMQLLEGAPLSRVMDQRLSVEAVLRYASDILRGLAAAHAKGVIHRDLKPDNIFVQDGRAILVDFGLAKLVADPRAANLTTTGEAIGTPHYMAPEQIRNTALDFRADLYAVGCVVYQMLVGRPPFDATAAFLLFDAHLHHPAPTILRPDVPPHVTEAIRCALAKHPAARHASADAMRHALVRAPERRKKWPFVATGVALGVIGGALAFVATNAAVEKPREPVLQPGYESALQTMQDLVAKRQYPRKAAVMMACSFHRGYQQSVGPADYRAYLRRATEMFGKGYDIDLATECAR